MGNTRTTRTRLEMLLRHVYGKDCMKKSCTCGKQQKLDGLYWGLFMLGIEEGTYKTFDLDAKWGFKFDDGLCKLGQVESGQPDPGWQEFINEVVSLVGE